MRKIHTEEVVDLEEALLELGKQSGLGRIAPDHEGVCRLWVEERYMVTFEKALEPGRFYVSCVVGVLPDQDQNKVLRFALAGNLFGRDTRQASLGYDAHINSLILFQRFEEAHLTAPLFDALFQEFIAVVELWTKRLAEGRFEGRFEGTEEQGFDLGAQKEKRVFFA